ncbi:MAG: hypothetical protein PVH62_09405 [Anaerolineae bacterium]|jgi:hypothetical protein
MKGQRKALLGAAAVVLVMGGCLLAAWVWTAVNLRIAKNQGVYASPEDGIRACVEEGFIDVQESEMRDAGPDSRNGKGPYVWYAGARVWAAACADGRPLPPDGNVSFGHFYVRVENGWVLMSEAQAPYFTSFWMRVFGLS